MATPPISSLPQTPDKKRKGTMSGASSSKERLGWIGLGDLEGMINVDESPSKKMKGQASMSTRAGKARGDDSALFVPSTIIKLLEVTSAAHTDIDEDDFVDSGDMFRVTRVLAAGTATGKGIVVDGEPVEVSRKGQGNVEFVRRKTIFKNVAIKLERVQPRIPSHLSKEFSVSEDLYNAFKNERVGSRPIHLPYLPLKAFATSVESASETEARKVKGGNWLKGCFHACILELAIPLTTILKEPSISNEHAIALFQSAYKAVKSLHMVKRVHRDLKMENFVIKIGDEKNEGGVKEKDEVLLVDMETVVREGIPWLNEKDGTVLIQPVGTISHMSLSTIAAVIYSFLQAGVKSGHLKDWETSEVDQLRGRLLETCNDTLTKDQDLWSLGITYLSALAPKYAAATLLTDESFMKLLRQLTGPLASPDYRDFLASLASISAGYSSIYDSRTYLLTQDENYGTGSAPCEGVEISAPIDGSVYGDLLRELLVRPITNSMSNNHHTLRVNYNQNLESRLSALSTLAEASSSTKNLLSPTKSASVASRALGVKTLELQPEANISTSSKSESGGRVRCTQIIDGVLTGSVVAFRQLQPQPGSKTDRIFRCKLPNDDGESCLFATSHNDPFQQMVNHLSHQTKGKIATCGYLAGAGKGRRIGVEVFDPKGARVKFWDGHNE